MEEMVGIGLAGLSAVTTNVGFLLRHRGAVMVEDVDPRHLVHSAVVLFRSKWWTIGFALAIVAYLLHASALTLVSLSAIQAVLAAGIVVMAVLAERFFGLDVGPRQWIGVGLASAGLIGLALTADVEWGQGTTDYHPAAMIGFCAALTAAGLVTLVIGWRARHGVLLAVATGLLLTVTHVAFKAASGKADGGLLPVLERPYAYVVVVGGVVAFFASARSLQLGPAVPVIAVTAITGNACAIAGGIVVFGDTLGSGPVAIVFRVLAFALVIGASTLIPGPLRGARTIRRRARGPRQRARRYPAEPARPAA
jgi:multidrug transporter EmrE-like cation transporter